MGNPVHIWSQCGDWLVRVDFRKWGSWFWFWFWFSWQWCGVGVLLWSLGVWVYLWTDADAVYCTVTWPAVTECKLLDDDNAGLWMNDGSGRIALFFLSFFHCLGSWCGWKSEWRTWLGLCLAVSFQHQRSSAPVSWFCFALWNKFLISLQNNLPHPLPQLYLSISLLYIWSTCTLFCLFLIGPSDLQLKRKRKLE